MLNAEGEKERKWFSPASKRKTSLHLTGENPPIRKNRSRRGGHDLAEGLKKKTYNSFETPGRHTILFFKEKRKRSLSER